MTAIGFIAFLVWFWIFVRDPSTGVSLLFVLFGALVLYFYVLSL